MEDVLDLYGEEYDPARPVVCLDEMPYQLLGETREPIAMEPGEPERRDYEYERRGTLRVVFHARFEPKAGKRYADVTESRTKADFAQQVKLLVDERYPDAQLIRLVVNNLNTHTGGALYEAFEPPEARRLLNRLEFRYTPKHGSWLNQVEIELSVLSGQCLDRRIPDIEALRAEVGAWQEERNGAGATVDWRFTTRDAREKLRRIYPATP